MRPQGTILTIANSQFNVIGLSTKDRIHCSEYDRSPIKTNIRVPITIDVAVLNFRNAIKIFIDVLVSQEILCIHICIHRTDGDWQLRVIARHLGNVHRSIGKSRYRAILT